MFGDSSASDWHLHDQIEELKYMPVLKPFVTVQNVLFTCSPMGIATGDAGDVRDALGAAADLVEGCAAMGRLQAMLQTEESGARFSAVATDLALAVGALCTLRDHVPPDVSEDLPLLKRQLECLRFASCAAQERLTWQLQQALALHSLQAHGRSEVQAASTATVPEALLQEALLAAGVCTAHKAVPCAWHEARLLRLVQQQGVCFSRRGRSPGAGPLHCSPPDQSVVRAGEE